MNAKSNQIYLHWAERNLKLKIGYDFIKRESLDPLSKEFLVGIPSSRCAFSSIWLNRIIEFCL